MYVNRTLAKIARRRFMTVIGSALPMFIAGLRIVHAQDKSVFPDGYVMHVIEVVEKHKKTDSSQNPSLLPVEIKCSQ